LYKHGIKLLVKDFSSVNTAREVINNSELLALTKKSEHARKYTGGRASDDDTGHIYKIERSQAAEAQEPQNTRILGSPCFSRSYNTFSYSLVVRDKDETAILYFIHVLLPSTNERTKYQVKEKCVCL